jgi:ubiquinone/menaquinone biosynthesis C-methylase UbiE
MLRVTFQYCDDCPSHEQALARLRRVLSDEGIAAEIEITKVETDEQARRFRFIGSPTILLNDVDIDPPITNHYGLACRAYRLEDGRISPLPSEEMIRRAIRRES